MAAFWAQVAAGWIASILVANAHAYLGVIVVGLASVAACAAVLSKMLPLRFERAVLLAIAQLLVVCTMLFLLSGAMSLTYKYWY